MEEKKDIIATQSSVTDHDNELRPKVDNMRTEERNTQSLSQGHQRAKEAKTRAGAKLTAKPRPSHWHARKVKSFRI